MTLTVPRARPWSTFETLIERRVTEAELITASKDHTPAMSVDLTLYRLKDTVTDVEAVALHFGHPLAVGPLLEVGDAEIGT